MPSARHIVFVTAVLPTAMYFLSSFDIVEGDMLMNQVPEATVAVEHPQSVGAESKPTEEGRTFEGDVEAIICLLAVLVLFGIHLYHQKLRRHTKVDKMGYAQERQVATAEHIPAKETITSATEAKEVQADPQKAKFEYYEDLSQHAKALNVEGIETTLIDLEHKYGTLHVADYSFGILHLSKAGERIKAHKWLRRTMEFGLVPNQRAFNSVINAYVKHGELHQALLVAADMRDAGMELDTVAYNMIIDGWARVGDVAACQRWMTMMLDSDVQPTVVTFASVMRACAAAGLTKQLEEWYALSHKYGIEMDVVCFGSVINAFAGKDDMVNATKWLMRCIDCGVQPTVQCFSGMLASVLRGGDLDLAAKVIARMRADGVEPDGGVFSHCVVAAVKTGQRKRAQLLADECAVCNCRLTNTAQVALASARLRFRRDPRVDVPEQSPARNV